MRIPTLIQWQRRNYSLGSGKSNTTPAIGCILLSFSKRCAERKQSPGAVSITTTMHVKPQPSASKEACRHPGANETRLADYSCTNSFPQRRGIETWGSNNIQQ